MRFPSPVDILKDLGGFSLFCFYARLPATVICQLLTRKGIIAAFLHSCSMQLSFFFSLSGDLDAFTFENSEAGPEKTVANYVTEILLFCGARSPTSPSCRNRMARHACGE